MKTIVKYSELKEIPTVRFNGYCVIFITERRDHMWRLISMDVHERINARAGIKFDYPFYKASPTIKAMDRNSRKKAKGK